MTGIDIAGTTPDGDIPPRFADECRLALERVGQQLADRGLTFRDVRHFAYTVRDIEAFRQYQTLVFEALGNARAAMTLRLVTSLPNEGQRIAFSFSAESGD